MYGKKTYKKKNKHEKKKEQYRDSFVQDYIPLYKMRSSLGLETRIEESTDFPNLREGCHKRFSVIQEKSLFLMHELEYAREYNLKLRRRRSSKSLPDPWDDYPSYVWDLQKSWKHSTKRKNQYYRDK